MPGVARQSYLGMATLVRMTASMATGVEVPEFGMGDRIRKARRWRGHRFTQAEIAAAIRAAGWDISEQAVGHWESGKNDVQADKRELVAIAVALKTGIPRDWILTGQHIPNGDRPRIKTGYRNRRIHRDRITPDWGVHLRPTG